MTLQEIGKWIVPAEKELSEKHVEAEAHEDMICTTLLYAYMLHILLARYITDPEERTRQLKDIMMKLGTLEEYLCSEECPRSKEKRVFHKFATNVLRAEIFDRMEMYTMCLSWAEKALSYIMDNAFLGWPPFVVVFFPNLVSVIARNRSLEMLHTLWGRIDLFRREYHMLDQLCFDIRAILEQNGISPCNGSNYR